MNIHLYHVARLFEAQRQLHSQAAVFTFTLGSVKGKKWSGYARLTEADKSCMTATLPRSSAILR